MKIFFPIVLLLACALAFGSVPEKCEKIVDVVKSKGLKLKAIQTCQDLVSQTGQKSVQPPFVCVPYIEEKNISLWPFPYDVANNVGDLAGSGFGYGNPPGAWGGCDSTHDGLGKETLYCYDLNSGTRRIHLEMIKDKLWGIRRKIVYQYTVQCGELQNID